MAAVFGRFFVFLHFASLLLNRALQAIRHIDEKTAEAADVAAALHSTLQSNAFFDAAEEGDVASIADHLAVDPSRFNWRDR